MKATLYWINGPWPGRLAIAPRPRGDDWLEDEVASWKQAGVDVVVSALTRDEVAELALENEAMACQQHGLDWFEITIPDRGLPSSQLPVLELVRAIEGKLSDGKNVLVHCRQGIGRSSMLAASVLASGGVDVNSAFQRITTARGRPVPDTPEQQKWVTAFARDILAAGTRQ
jgi:protein-tyrosine phosphatase